jgi:hypothetical protein
MWIKPPSVYDVTIPSSHMMKRMRNKVQSIVETPPIHMAARYDPFLLRAGAG